MTVNFVCQSVKPELQKLRTRGSPEDPGATGMGVGGGRMSPHAGDGCADSK